MAAMLMAVSPCGQACSAQAGAAHSAAQRVASMLPAAWDCRKPLRIWADTSLMPPGVCCGGNKDKHGCS